jgi:hypothetical protein
MGHPRGGVTIQLAAALPGGAESENCFSQPALAVKKKLFVSVHCQMPQYFSIYVYYSPQASK